MQLLHPDQLRSIERHLEHRLDDAFAGQGLDAMARMIHGYVMSGGKRVRPQLAVWTYLMSGDLDAELSLDAHAPALLDMAAAWEMFHAFLLVHDDIIDGAETRRDQAALHRTLASLDSDSPVFGRNLAIVAGDLLYTASMRLVHDLDVDAETHRRLLKLFGRVSMQTGFGQAIDIVQSHLPMDLVEEETLLREYLLKTAVYTFEGPMLSGAILAGLDAAAQDAISRYALSLGQAYQLHNDLIDLCAPAHEGSDLVQGKRTVTIVRHRGGIDEAARSDLDGKLLTIAHANGHAIELAESLRQELLDADITGPTRKLIDELLDTSATAAADPSLPPTLATGMTGLLGLLRTRYFATV